MHFSDYTTGIRRLLSVSVIALAVAGFTACDSMLEVENEAAIDDVDLNDPSLATTLANSALGRAQRYYDDLSWFSAVFTDEAVNGHNFIQWKEIDLRQMRDDNDLDHFELIHEWRYLADTVATRLETLLPTADNRASMLSSRPTNAAKRSTS